MTYCRCGISNLCAILAVGLLLSCATEALAENGPQPTLRLDLTQAYPQYQLNLSQSGQQPILHSTAQGQLVVFPGNKALVSDDQGSTWHNWDAYQRLAQDGGVQRHRAAGK